MWGGKKASLGFGLINRELVDAPPLQTFKVRVDKALSNLIKLWMSLFIAQELV